MLIEIFGVFSRGKCDVIEVEEVSVGWLEIEVKVNCLLDGVYGGWVFNDGVMRNYGVIVCNLFKY